MSTMISSTTSSFSNHSTHERRSETEQMQPVMTKYETCQQQQHDAKDTNDDCHRSVTLALEKMKTALRELPMKEKRSYLEAKNTAPDVVRRETPFVNFLKRDGLDPMAAAKRLCEYWRTRLVFLNKDSAVLPMTLHGAMLDSQELLLECDAMLLEDDIHGRGVLFMDGTKQYNQDEYARLLLFFAHQLSKRDSVNRKGYVLLLNVDGCNIQDEQDRACLETILHICTSALPIRNRAIHLFCGNNSTNAAESLCTTLRDVQIYVHRKNADQSYQDTVLPHGFILETLSDALGGGYTSDQFLDWLASLEWDEKRQQQKLKEHKKLQISHAQTARAA